LKLPADPQGSVDHRFQTSGLENTAYAQWVAHSNQG